MLDFLDLLADRVRLKGFQKYRGDLDIKEDLHGEHSYHTVYQNHEIMFNVAPLVPSTKANQQCIERKGLVGNAFVCIVFQEAGAIFSPDFISGKVTQIYITVQPLMHDDELYYKIGIWRRNDITSVLDPPGGIYKCDKSFLPYFLTLILNAVNVAIESPSLRARVFEQRQRIKCEELKKLCSLFNLGPLPDFNSDFDVIHSQSDMRSSIRSENSVNTVNTTTNDSANSNTGRTSPISSKKKGFSKKIFGVFSSRSASLTSTTTSSNQNTNDNTSTSSQGPLLPDAVMSLARSSVPLNRENITRQRSIKGNQAPTPPFRSSNSQAASVHPPMPSISIMNPHNSDKFQSYLVATKIAEEQQSTTTSPSSSEEEDSEDESSEDEKPLPKRPPRLS
jgi:hypothetical protein